jgi:hypothetical protein
MTYLPAGTLCVKDPLEVACIRSGVLRKEVDGCNIAGFKRVSLQLHQLFKLLTDFLHMTCQRVSFSIITEYLPKLGNTGACNFAAISLLKSWRSFITPLCLD